jgi:hypothetical protein
MCFEINDMQHRCFVSHVNQLRDGRFCCQYIFVAISLLFVVVTSRAAITLLGRQTTEVIGMQFKTKFSAQPISPLERFTIDNSHI